MIDPEAYKNLINRNLGLITSEQQDILKNSCVAVFGLGGLGGIIAEVLCRSGICRFKILDNDRFDPTNLNRQVFSFNDTVGRMKTDVTEEFLKKINPGVKIEKFIEVTTENIGQVLENCGAVVLAIDSIRPCVVISRAARERGIPLIEGWAIPFGNVRVLTKSTPSLEEVYGLPTLGREIDSISADEFRALSFHMLQALKKIEGIDGFYSPCAIERIMKGEIPSFAPIVWLTAVLMSLETVKVLLNWGEIALSPKFSLYNPFNNTIPKQDQG